MKKKKKKKCRSKQKTYLDEDYWICHLIHLQNGLKYEKRCKVCRLVVPKKQEPHARK